MTRPNAPGIPAILHVKASEPLSGYARLLPSVDLQPFVELFWMVRWDLRGQPPQLAETLPQPAVNWITQARSSTIRGVATGRFSTRLHGRGRVFGVKFKPGGFFPFLRSPISAITDNSLLLGKVFGTAGESVGRELRRLATEEFGNEEQMMAIVERFLRARQAAIDPELERVAAIMNAIRSERRLCRVDQLTVQFNLGSRALERLFSRYVGVSPKWVIQRYRIFEAVARAAGGERVSWSRFAATLGYSDQTHFIKHFKALVGTAPAEYARRLHAGDRFRN